MGWSEKGAEGIERAGVEGGNGEHKPGPGLAPFEKFSEGNENVDIPEPPEPQEPDLPPLNESVSAGDGGEDSPEDSSKKQDASTSEKTSEGSEGEEGSEYDIPGSGESAYEQLKQAVKEVVGRDIGSIGMGDRPLNVPLGSTLGNPENPLFRLKSAVEIAAGGGIEADNIWRKRR